MPRLPDEDSLPDPEGDGLEAAYPGLYEMTDDDVARHGTPEAIDDDLDLERVELP